MEDDLKILKVEYLSNYLLDLRPRWSLLLFTVLTGGEAAGGGGEKNKNKNK